MARPAFSTRGSLPKFAAAASSGRRWEVDASRGVAFSMMALYHLLFDLHYFAGWPIAVTSGFWGGFADATAGLFLSLVGISLTLSYARWRARQADPYFPHLVRRGFRILGYGFLVTLVTWLVDPRQVVLFGILHLIGVSILLAWPFLGGRLANLVLGAVLVGLGSLVEGVVLPAGFPWLLWLGLPPAGFSSFDYRPLLPWFGVVLWGIAAGNLLYPHGRPLRPLPDWSGLPPARLLAWLGRHALVLYLVHQPVMIALLVLLGLVPLQALGLS
jgi:uncharacterized membrane protein